MPKHTLKLLTLLTAVTVVPTSAGSRAPIISPTPAVASWTDNSVSCPYERARLAAAAREAAAKSRPTTITLTDRVPADAPLLGRGSAFINP